MQGIGWGHSIGVAHYAVTSRHDHADLDIHPVVNPLVVS